MMRRFSRMEDELTLVRGAQNTDLGEELMMLPTDMALIEDEKFLPWVKKCKWSHFVHHGGCAAVACGEQRGAVGRVEKLISLSRADAEDRDAFYSDFAAVFSKLIELGVTRDDDYESAPTMSKEAGDQKEREAKSKI